MRSMIRWTLCLSVAAMLGRGFADAPVLEEQELTPTDATIAHDSDFNDQEIGAGGREGRFVPTSDNAKGDEVGRKNAATEDMAARNVPTDEATTWSNQQWLQSIWAPNP